MIRGILAALVVAAGTPLAAQEKASRDSDFQVSNIEARLLYEGSGQLSADVAGDPKIDLWNTIVGEGGAKENANDLLVTVLLVGPGEHNSSTPLIISVRNAQGKVVASRRIGQMLLEKRTYRSLLLQNVGCAGRLRLSAEYGASRRVEEVSLDCGE